MSVAVIEKGNKSLTYRKSMFVEIVWLFLMLVKMTSFWGQARWANMTSTGG
jgi:hypothetical protein